MKEDEINKIIAEFMGWKELDDQAAFAYAANDDSYLVQWRPTKSIDSMLRVIAKLDKEIWIQIKRHEVADYHMICIGSGEDSIFRVYDDISRTPKLLASACVELIQGLK